MIKKRFSEIFIPITTVYLGVTLIFINYFTESEGVYFELLNSLGIAFLTVGFILLYLKRFTLYVEDKIGNLIPNYIDLKSQGIVDFKLTNSLEDIERIHRQIQKSYNISISIQNNISKYLLYNLFRGIEHSRADKIRFLYYTQFNNEDEILKSEKEADRFISSDIVGNKRIDLKLCNRIGQYSHILLDDKLYLLIGGQEGTKENLLFITIDKQRRFAENFIRDFEVSWKLSIENKSHNN